ncbi:MAG: MlaD family protein [Gammaproteobacteria bacterium]|nr:MlaD family protein [Gammaproteobacteria bacterium]
MNKDEDSSMNSGQFAQPKISAKKSFSPIWILPIVALFIGLGLILKSYLNAGIMITLQVPTAEGIVVGKTQVLYKGISAGVVKDRTITADLQNVILHIEMDKRTEHVLHDDAKFWIVEPRISLSGVSGLDTLIGGRYIAIDIDDEGNEPKRDYIALSVPPPPAADTPGLHIKLRLSRLQSIDRGTTIYFKQIPVGEVINYTLEENDTEIHAWVLIKPEYAHLVKENSHFYNVSGIKVNAGLSGVQIETESLISVLAGGIAFYNPTTKEDSPPAKHGAFYLLYSDFDSAQVGIPVVFRFKNTESVQENITKIKFQGHDVGRLGKFSYDKKTNEIIALASIDPILENALTENTQFWVVKPSVSILNISGLDALLSGNYIQMRPALKGKMKREFTVSEYVPPLSNSVPGLHILLESKTLGSISKKSPIYFKSIPVGHVEGYTLSEDSEKVQLKVFIKPEFSHLVKKNSHFYNVSGINIKGGVSGIKVQTESLTALVKGGIAFYTPDFEEPQPKSENGDVFELFKDFDEAKAGVEIFLTFDSAVGLIGGITKVIYKGMEFGHVQKLIPNKGKKTVTAKVILDPISEEALVEDTKFWMVRPKISLGEIKNLGSLINGDYITLRIGSSKKKRREFDVLQSRPAFDQSYPGLHLKLKSSKLGSISIGAPVMYNRIKIGDVQDYELAKDRTNINILIHIWPQYMDMVNSESRFYNASGFQVDASLAGIEVHTESIESIIRGGIALFNERNDDEYLINKPSTKNSQKKLKKISDGHVYTLFRDFEAARSNAFYVRVQFQEPKGLVVGSKVQYRGINVGKVEEINLSKNNSDSVWVTLELNSLLKPVLGKKSSFWVTTSKFGLARTENLDALVKGSYISVQPKKGKAAKVFIGLEEKPFISQSKNGFSVSLTASRLSSIKTGDPVYYRQVKVGTVVGYELADTADQILIHLEIRNRFKPLIRENSKFWHASGIAVDISLFGTSSIRTESLESIISGGIAFATPDNQQMGKMLSSGSFFVLHDTPKAEWTKWNPIIHLEKETQQD